MTEYFTICIKFEYTGLCHGVLYACARLLRQQTVRVHSDVGICTPLCAVFSAISELHLSVGISWLDILSFDFSSLSLLLRETEISTLIKVRISWPFHDKMALRVTPAMRNVCTKFNVFKNVIFTFGSQNLVVLTRNTVCYCHTRTWDNVLILTFTPMTPFILS